MVRGLDGPHVSSAQMVISQSVADPLLDAASIASALNVYGVPAFAAKACVTL